MINREDMLELTRRMTPARNCFSRVAGAYMDAEGYEDGSFNTFFRNLGAADTKKNLALAKAIPFSATNEQLMEYSFPEGEALRNSFRPVLFELNRKRLQDDGLLSVVYEVMGENYRTDREYGIFIFSGSYDVPVKASDNEWLEGSEEVYDFLVCAVSPLVGEYEMGEPEFGFLFPAFADRSGDSDLIYMFNKDPGRPQSELMKKILGM
ncbi:MAG: DUF4317 domain-containing protein [Eubacterium sp.]|nr:DUF4317 domain-containing protein [Eubacterium sp.]